MGDLLRITRTLSLPRGALTFRFTASRGPGGQNVNKTATKACLRFQVRGSPHLPEAAARRIEKVLARRITRAGVLQIVSDRHRDRLQNVEDCLAKLRECLARALRPTKTRRPTKPSEAARARRREAKRRRARNKQQRRPPVWG